MIFGTRLFLRCLLHYNNSHTRFVLLLNFVLLYIHLQNGDISDRKQFEEVCKAFESLSPGKKKCLHDRKHLLIRITLIKLVEKRFFALQCFEANVMVSPDIQPKFGLLYLCNENLLRIFIHSFDFRYLSFLQSAETTQSNKIVTK